MSLRKRKKSIFYKSVRVVGKTRLSTLTEEGPGGVEWACDLGKLSLENGIWVSQTEKQ